MPHKTGSAKPWVESQLALSVRSLKSLGLEGAGRSGSFSFIRGRKVLAEMSFQANKQLLNIRYQATSVVENAVQTTKNYELNIQLSTSPCHFGGKRYWLCCPKCKQRRYHLYFIYHNFLCRDCAGLAYRLSALSKTDRLYAQKHKLGREIFSDYQYGQGSTRRKGMHRKTYYRKLAQYLHIERQLITVLDNFLESLSCTSPVEEQ